MKKSQPKTKNNNGIRITLEMHFDRIKEFYDKNKRAPNGDEVPSGTRKALTKEYGSWNLALKAALGFNAAYHKMKIITNDELAASIVELQKKLNRVPRIDELPHKKVLLKRFGGPNEAMEFALNTSPRIEIFRALVKLTPPECEWATTHEIKSALDKNGSSFSTLIIQAILLRAGVKNFTTKRRDDRVTLWKLTPAGKDFLKTFRSSSKEMKS